MYVCVCVYILELRVSVRVIVLVHMYKYIYPTLYCTVCLRVLLYIIYHTVKNNGAWHMDNIIT